jgi:acetyltransferase
MQKRMNQLFSPQHVAVIGATSRTAWFKNILIYCDKIGFKGSLYPVNPNYKELEGIKTFSSITELPDNTDFAVVLLNHRLAFDAIVSLNKRGIKNIFLISSGYAEVGEEGKEKQEALKKYCKENDIYLIGPNCLGFINFPEKTSVFAGGSVDNDLIPGHIGVIGQSGAASELMVSALLKKNLGISLYVTSGNEALITIEDLVEYLIRDEATKIITGFVEGFKDIPRVKKLAALAAEKKIPIILLKIGRSSEGVKVAASHTGALTGNDLIMDGFFKQFGLIRVDSIEELANTAELFTHCSLPKGDRLGLFIFSGGLCGMYADLCAKYGIKVPPLSDKTIQGLKTILPDFAQPDNPLDITGAADRNRYHEIVDLMVKDKNLDIIAPLCMPPKDSHDVFSFGANSAFMAHIKGEKPLAPIVFKQPTDYARTYFKDHGIYCIEQPEEGFKAISHLINYGKFLRQFKSRQDK